MSMSLIQQKLPISIKHLLYKQIHVVNYGDACQNCKNLYVYKLITKQTTPRSKLLVYLSFSKSCQFPCKQIHEVNYDHSC